MHGRGDADGYIVLPAGDLHDPPGAVVVLPGFVDLQLHAEIAGTVATEQGFRLVVVILNGPVILFPVVAGQAQGLVIVSRAQIPTA